MAYISSRLVKEVASLGGPLDGLVPPAVALRMTGRRANRTIARMTTGALPLADRMSAVACRRS